MQEDRTHVKELPRQEQELWYSAATGADTQNVHTEGCSHEHQKHDSQTKEGTHGDVDCRLGFLKEEPVLTTVTPSISILNVLVAKIENKSMHLPIILSCEKSGNKNVKTKALLDTGAGGKFIDHNFVLRNNIRTYKVAKPITVYDVDGMENKTGTITRYVDVNLQIGNRTTSTKLLVTGLGCQKIILGFPWFEEQNPEINWETGTLTWRKETNGQNNGAAFSADVLDKAYNCKRGKGKSKERD